MPNKIKVGVVGCGYWGPNLIRNFRGLADCQLKTMCDVSEQRLKHLKSLYPEVIGETSYERMLNDADLKKLWLSEVEAMRTRILDMRETLIKALSGTLPGRSFDHYALQRGMFSYTGLSATQVDRLRDEFAIYLVRSGRICVAGLNSSNVDYVAKTFATVSA